MLHPTFALCLLTVGTAVAQPQSPSRERQDRRTFLALAPTELRVAADNVTTVIINGPLDRDSLVVDRTRFKWAEVSDHMLNLQLVTDLGSGERLVVKANFKDRAVPAQAVFVVTTHPTEVDGTVEVDRRANTPEALTAALAQKEAELEELKARCEASGPAGVVLSKWLAVEMRPIPFHVATSSAEPSGLKVQEGAGYEGTTSTLVAISLRNLPGQKPWAPGEARLINASGKPVKVLSVQMRPAHLAPGEEGLVVVEVKEPPWTADKAFSVELVDASGQRRLSFNLRTE
ncbi:MAG: DUF2381 family protein [Hyalangium sp.]|uniref:DUF2381 family protein n=1 Tax=Hyalangium sp. TaxID=2028555 RepID=UPI00389B23CC